MRRSRGLSRRDFLRATALAATASSLGCSVSDGPPGRKSAALWFTYGGKNREVLEALVKRFNESQSEHFIRAIYQGDYFEGLAKLRTAIAARRAPALSHVVGEVVPYLAEANVLEPLDDYPGAHDFGIVDALGQRGSWVGGADRPLVTLPFNRSTPIAYLNGTLFAERKLEAPKTWSELRETARAFSETSAGRTIRYGFGCPIDWWFWAALVGQAGGNVVEDDGRVTLGGEAGERALDFWKTLALEDRSMKPPPGRDYNAWEQTNQDFLAGRVAMIWTSTAFLKYLEQNAPFPVVAAALPAEQRRSVPTGGTHWVMLRSAPREKKQTAWAFLRFMHETESAITWATRTGYLPVTKAAVAKLEADGHYRQHPNDRVALDQLDVARPWPWSPQLFRVQREIVQPRLEGAVLGGRDSHSALDEARSLAARWR
ncbi:MAG: ABC transporter substrate-binding protein [Myxococcales bacterium]|nr:ABC transporter substrate-binding protein [Myxococcales bacterium]